MMGSYEMRMGRESGDVLALAGDVLGAGTVALVVLAVLVVLVALAYTIVQFSIVLSADAQAMVQAAQLVSHLGGPLPVEIAGSDPGLLQGQQGAAQAQVHAGTQARQPVEARNATSAAGGHAVDFGLAGKLSVCVGSGKHFTIQSQGYAMRSGVPLGPSFSPSSHLCSMAARSRCDTHSTPLQERGRNILWGRSGSPCVHSMPNAIEARWTLLNE